MSACAARLLDRTARPPWQLQLQLQSLKPGSTSALLHCWQGSCELAYEDSSWRPQ